MKKWILFVFCLLTVQLSFSQTRYPEKIVLQGDTLVVITPAQLGTANGIFQERNNYRDELVPQMNVVISQQDSLIRTLNLQVVSWEEMDRVNKSIIESLKLQETQVLKEKRRNCWIVGGLCLSAGVLIGALIFKK
jgi:hypothetical protein